jgi:2-dehydropantoate 2-reductase
MQPARRGEKGEPMRICVYGAGATGGHLAVKLATAGHDVAVVARGDHLAAIRAQGLSLIEGDLQRTAQVQATDDPALLGQQDLVMTAVKATGLAAVADRLAPLVGPRTLVAFPQNGMAWWYPTGLPAGWPAPPDIAVFRLGQRFLQVLRPGQVLGGSLYSANEVIAPGVVRNTSPGRNGLTLGAIVPGREADVAQVREALEAAGIRSPAVQDIRQTLWSKLLINMSGSTIALATENRSSICRTDPALAEIYRRVIREGLEITRAHGYALDGIVDAERLLGGLLDHKPSLLQDYEQRRPMEVAEIVEAPIAFARAQGVPTPTLDTLAAIVVRRARDRGLL